MITSNLQLGRKYFKGQGYTRSYGELAKGDTSNTDEKTLIFCQKYIYRASESFEDNAAPE